MTYPTKKLGEVLELNYGKGISKNERDPNGKYPVYGANGVLGYANKFFIDQEAVIVGRKGSAGEVTRVSGKFWPSDVTYFVLGNDQIDIDYAFHLLKSLRLQRFAVGVKPGINRNRVYDIEVSLPPLAQQKKIVMKLEKLLAKVDGAKKLRAEAQESTNQLLSAELHKIFEEGKIKGWKEKNIGDPSIMKITSGGTPSKSHPEYYGGEIKWLKSGELNDDINITNSENYITKEAIKRSSAKIFPKDTVLLAMYGATAGKLGILGVEASTNQAVAGMICEKHSLNYKYLYYVLGNIRNHIIAKAWGGAQPNLSQTIIKNFKIPLPSLSEQKKIVTRLDSISEKSKQLQEYQKVTSNDLLALEQSILSKAFFGKFV